MNKKYVITLIYDLVCLADNPRVISFVSTWYMLTFKLKIKAPSWPQYCSVGRSIMLNVLNCSVLCAVPVCAALLDPTLIESTVPYVLPVCTILICSSFNEISYHYP